MSLASATTYVLPFFVSITAAIAALACLAYLYYIKARLFAAGLLPGVLAVYALVDVGLRWSVGVRLLDLVR